MNVLGVGTDITECLRIGKMIERHGELFVQRVYTPKEIEYCRGRKMAIQHFAGRWAAKEAILKALGTGWRQGISWRDIEVINGVTVVVASFSTSRYPGVPKFTRRSWARVTSSVFRFSGP